MGRLESSKVIIFGAGAVGRGFIGEIFLEAGWRVVFIDRELALVEGLSSGGYRHYTVGVAGEQEKFLTGFRIISSSQESEIVEEIVSARCIFTAIGANNLPEIVDILARGIVQRKQRSGLPIDIFLAENLLGGRQRLRALLAESLSKLGCSSDQLLQEVGIVETSVGRMIPASGTRHSQGDDPWAVFVEPYRKLPFDRAACKGLVPEIPELIEAPGIPFDFYIERKLYIHNQGHCVVAYLGQLAGKTEISEAMEIPFISDLAKVVMTASGIALAKKYGVSFDFVLPHILDLLIRFQNVALHDSCERVGRDPRRKLQPGERFLGAVALALEWGAPRPLLVGLAVAVEHLLRQEEFARVSPVLEEVKKVVKLLCLEDRVFYAQLRKACRSVDPLQEIESLATEVSQNFLSGYAQRRSGWQ